MIRFDYSKLKGKIVEMYGSQAAFATALGISANMLSLYMTNNKRFTSKLIDKMINLLKIPKEEIGTYFFTPEVR